ncbi:MULTISPECIES: YodC family protein [Moraxella]|uniref:YodC family protein n=1 Tax=Moraxella TaxID=475 RepID=UPI0009899633|nr:MULTISPECIES: DUF2158 domain-containing protein [Moraxella]MPW68525.1 DUF2158 domain-containing protein [Moraxella catarrhalis]MPX19807.1 DUF2158 domain-containing protein [Moraxella catarrhalis]MPX37098.1 DUF2158 domain-containing protein [Moraxella catarrhalis]MPX62440.1 DUF2158 domain-containing protein [Moraxella catarrhalis]MPX69216.1 DUF2158 domain-containing protein [Moraxella catarrhalis]
MFAVGQVVKLKSGGPNMTVKAVLSDNPSMVMRYVTESKDSYQYQWFAGKKLESGMFPHSSLIIVDDKESTNE